MKKCWDEKYEKRPEFSFLVHSVGNMLTESFKKVQHCVLTLGLTSQLFISLFTSYLFPQTLSDNLSAP